jgi:site-specific DNA recombinase
LESLKTDLMAPELVNEFVQAFHAEVNRQCHEAELVAGSARRELEDVAHKLEKLVDAIAEGFRAPALQQRLDDLTFRKANLERAGAEGKTVLPRLPPNLAEVYRRKVERLHEALKDPAVHAEALEILRGLIDKVVVRHGERGFEIELVGEVANMVALPSQGVEPNGQR